MSAPSLAAFRRRGVKVAATCGADGTAAAALWASKATARKLGLRTAGSGRTTVRVRGRQDGHRAPEAHQEGPQGDQGEAPASLRITVALALQDGAPLHAHDHHRALSGTPPRRPLLLGPPGVVPFRGPTC